MARITGKSTKEVQADRVGLARKIAQEYGVWVILKGAATVTASPDGTIFVNTTGNPWMASGGQGDALSGILGGLLAQGIPPDDALPFGVYIHGLAADNIVRKNGPAPVLATDVIAEIPRLLGEGLREEEEEH
jgi:NAD(P)H-hydrate epimerase